LRDYLRERRTAICLADGSRERDKGTMTQNEFC
jgi:hypothetical protein